jgi:hypothetical protein
VNKNPQLNVFTAKVLEKEREKNEEWMPIISFFQKFNFLLKKKKI